MEENCALTTDGGLKDASEIAFYHSETDTRPIAPLPPQGNGVNRNKRGMSCFWSSKITLIFLEARRENQGEKMKQYLAEERLGSDGEVTKKFRPMGEKRPRKAAGDKTRALKRVKHDAEVSNDSASGSHDSDFAMGTSDDESSESDGETEPLTNAEVRNLWQIPLH